MDETYLYYICSNGKHLSPEWIAIIVSILIGLAGIFKLQDWIFRAKLKINLTLKSPDCHSISMRDSHTGNTVGNVYYLRFQVSNEGNSEAKNVQVMLSKLEVVQEGNFIDKEDFLPLNLKWSHFGNDTITSIPVEVFRHCDFGYLVGDSYKNTVLAPFPQIHKKAQVILKLDTIVEPNTGSHIVFPGKYRFTVLVSASNCDTVKRIFEMNLPDQWPFLEINKDFYIKLTQ